MPRGVIALDGDAAFRHIARAPSTKCAIVDANPADRRRTRVVLEAITDSGAL